MPSDLLNTLQDPARFPHPVTGFRVLETHISEVLLTGGHAYKIKKPVDFGFLDFRRLEDRRRFCEDEVRLNRRLSGDLYEGVVAITAAPDGPQLDGDGKVLEYAVKMREFPQDCLLDAVAARGALTAAALDDLARTLAEFHQRTPAAPPGHAQRAPEALMAPMRQNFRIIRPLLMDDEDRRRLDRLEARLAADAGRLRPHLLQRIADDRIRECHGDLHLGNIALLDGVATPFDCIEFNDAFRIIDVASDIAFLVMDLESRGLPDLARRFLNGWLEHSGDYGALAVIDFYKTYRALVRAKVQLLRLGQQPDAAGCAAAWAEYRRYAALAERFGDPRPVYLAIMRGVSAVGKSAVALRLVEAHGAVRLRSDVERKRLLGQQPEAAQGQLAAGIYSTEATARTYRHLLALASTVVQAGYAAVLDATFLQRDWRQAARRQAEMTGVPFVIVDCTAPDAVLLARLAARQAAGGDPSDATEAVIHRQSAAQEPLSAEERLRTLPLDTCDAAAQEGLPERLAALALARSAGSLAYNGVTAATAAAPDGEEPL